MEWLSRWHWFRSQLRLLSLERARDPIHIWFEFDESGKTLECKLEGKVTEDLLGAGARRREHARYYRDWVRSATREIGEIAKDIPGFRFSTKRDVVYKIVNSYGMGASVIVSVVNGQWNWRADIEDDRGTMKPSKAARRSISTSKQKRPRG